MAVDLDVADTAAPAGSVPDPPSPTETPAPGPVPPWLRRTGLNLGVIAVFTVPAVVLWWHAWTGGAASTVRCACLDPGQQAWFIAWPAYALAHGHDPFSSLWLWPPGGVNLLANASAPLAGLVVAPVTWVFGPFVATTLALTLAPGLSAWGCWVAARRITTWRPAQWLAGFVFGYTPFVVESVALGHLSVGLLVFPPLIFVVLHEICVRQRWSPWRAAVSLGLLLLGQFLVSPEILVITVVAGALGVGAAAASDPARFVRALPYAGRALALGAGVTAVLLALPAWDLLAGARHIHGAVWGGLHGLFVAQAWELWRAGPWRSAVLPDVVQGPQEQFLGVAVLVVAAASLAVAWRRRAAWVLAFLAIACTVLSWGHLLWTGPDHLVVSSWLPWGWVTNLPVFDDVSAIHFAAVTDLAVALLVAVGLDALVRRKFWRRLPLARVALVVATGAVMVVPIWRLYNAPLSVQHVHAPPWYTTAALTVPEGSVVVSYPFPASSSLTAQPMVWQAADGMRFRLAGGYVKVPGPSGAVIGTGPPHSAVRTLVDLTLPPGPPGTVPAVSALDLEHLRAALGTWGASYVVVSDRGTLPVEAAAVFTAATGRLPVIEHRAWVWNVAARPLTGPYDASSAAARLAWCLGSGGSLGPARSGAALPQALNGCVSGTI
jgi:hypothetical protein